MEEAIMYLTLATVIAVAGMVLIWKTAGGAK